MMSLSRRRFLGMSLGGGAFLASAPSVAGLFLRGAAHAAAKDANTPRVLVVVQLSGGNDGLNTVVPYADDDYARNRPTLRLAPEQLFPIDLQLGFHPRMEAFARLYREGALTIVQGVGSPDLPDEHDAAMHVWHSAAPDGAYCPTGWLGRMADAVWDPDQGRSPAAFVGGIQQPSALTAARVVLPSLRTAQDLVLETMPGQAAASAATRTKGANPLLAFAENGAAGARANSRRIQTVVASPAAQFDYPEFGLAENLRVIAQLVRAELGFRVFYAELGGGGIGGFDNHANQLGNHCVLLHQLAESIGGFAADLKRDGLFDRVALMTFSEFGRTVAENGRRGTGHGNAAPVFLVGGKVKGGLVGPHPSLTDLDGGALKCHIDFRRVYATVLEQWLGVESHEVLGGAFEPLDVFEI